MSEDKKTDQTLYCSFCGKSQREVKKLIAGPTVFICDECIYLCFSIVASDGSLDNKSLDEIVAKLQDEFPALVEKQRSAEQDDGGNDGGDQD